MPDTKPNDLVDKEVSIRKIAQFEKKLQAGQIKHALSSLSIRQSAKHENNEVTQLHYHYSQTDSLPTITVAYDGYICFRELLTHSNHNPIATIKSIWTKADLRESPAPFKAYKIHLFGSSFQCSVWKSLLLIEKGELASYSQIAKLIGKPLATRAVASAIAANKIAVSIPCHRIICKNGELGDFKWGKGLKQQLIRGEHTGELFL